MTRWFSHVACLLLHGGHYYLPVFERTRLFLRCAGCGKETRGWHNIGERPVSHRPIW